MSPPDTDAVFAALRSADPDLMDRDELAELTSRLAVHQAWCDALKVRVTRRQRQLASEGGAEPAHDLLSRHGRESSKRGKAAAEREQEGISTRSPTPYATSTTGCWPSSLPARQTCWSTPPSRASTTSSAAAATSPDT